MKQKSKHLLNPASYNKAVEEAYFTILKQAKKLIATIEQDELRFTLERANKANMPDTVLHEIITPMIYLRIECHQDAVMRIHFGIEPISKPEYLSAITSTFLRILYKQTAKEVTAFNIEDCVQTDWFINSCSEMYEYMETRNKYHSFKHIKYGGSASRRNQLLSVI